MLVPKYIIEIIFRKQDDLERRINRLEILLQKEAERRISSLKDEKFDKNYGKDALSVETIKEAVKEIRKRGGALKLKSLDPPKVGQKQEEKNP